MFRRPNSPLRGRPGLPSFGLGALLLVMCVLGGCLALARNNPLLAILVAAVAAAGLMRTGRVVGRLATVGRQPGNGQKLVVFLWSVGLVLTAGAITLVAAGLSGLAGWLAGSGLEVVFGEPWVPVLCTAWGLVLGMPVGLFAAARVVGRLWMPY